MTSSRTISVISGDGIGPEIMTATLRVRFDLYANVRPVFSIPGTRARYDKVDIITVRENTEGAYLAADSKIIDDGSRAESKMVIMRKGSCAGLVGGLGLAPGANIGQDTAIFEAVHGSAPDIAGRGIANPCALLLAAAQMLAYLGRDDRARLLCSAITTTIAAADRTTPDLGGSGSTGGFADAIVERIHAA
jgi:isocitrate/isopropylmalate dehydrogenase